MLCRSIRVNNIFGGSTMRGHQFTILSQFNIGFQEEYIAYHPDPELKSGDSLTTDSGDHDKLEWMVDVYLKILTQLLQDSPLSQSIPTAKKKLEDSRPTFPLGWRRSAVQQGATSALNHALSVIETVHNSRIAAERMKSKAVGAERFFESIDIAPNPDFLAYCLSKPSSSEVESDCFLNQAESDCLNDDSKPALDPQKISACAAACLRSLTEFGKEFFPENKPPENKPTEHVTRSFFDNWTGIIAALDPSQKPTRVQVEEALDLINGFRNKKAATAAKVNAQKQKIVLRKASADTLETKGSGDSLQPQKKSTESEPATATPRTEEEVIATLPQTTTVSSHAQEDAVTTASNAASSPKDAEDNTQTQEKPAEPAITTEQKSAEPVTTTPMRKEEIITPSLQTETVSTHLLEAAVTIASDAGSTPSLTPTQETVSVGNQGGVTALESASRHERANTSPQISTTSYPRWLMRLPKPPLPPQVIIDDLLLLS